MCRRGAHLDVTQCAQPSLKLADAVMVCTLLGVALLLLVARLFRGSRSAPPTQGVSVLKPSSYFLVASILVLSVANAAPPANWRSVDVSHFDVAGVRLGIGYEQAIVALGEHFELNPGESKRLRASTLYSRNRITNSELPTRITLKKNNVTLAISFHVRVPPNSTDAVAVTAVSYSLPSTTDNALLLKEAALQKYGAPSDDRRKANLMWCAHYNQISQCEPRKPKLALVGSTLTLTDYSIEDAASRMIEQDQSKTKPRL